MNHRQFKLLKKMKKGITLPLQTNISKAIVNTNTQQKIADYLISKEYCNHYVDKKDGEPYRHYRCNQRGEDAIAEHRINRLKLLPPWVSLLLSIVALLISIFIKA
jgi:hypothetical protein